HRAGGAVAPLVHRARAVVGDLLQEVTIADGPERFCLGVQHHERIPWRGGANTGGPLGRSARVRALGGIRSRYCTERAVSTSISLARIPAAWPWGRRSCLPHGQSSTATKKGTRRPWLASAPRRPDRKR